MSREFSKDEIQIVNKPAKNDILIWTNTYMKWKDIAYIGKTITTDNYAVAPIHIIFEIKFICFIFI